MMTAKKIYMLNESLLDDVEVDEVEDSLDELSQVVKNYKVVVDFLDYSSPEIVIKQYTFFESVMNRFKNKTGYIGSMDMNLKYSNGQCKKFLIEVGVTEDNLYDFNRFVIKLLIIMKSIICRMNVLGIGMRLAISSLEPEHKSGTLQFENNDGMLLISDESFYEREFDEYDFDANMHLLCKFAISGKLIRPLDSDGKRYAIHYKTKKCVLLFDECARRVNEKVYLVDAMDFSELKYDENHLMKIKMSMEGYYCYNFIKFDGEPLLNFNPIFCGDFNEGFASVQFQEDGLWNYVDTSGNILCKGKRFHTVCGFVDGYAKVKLFSKEGSVNFLRSDGSLVWNNDEPFLSTENFQYGYCIVRNFKNKENFLDFSGKLLLDDWQYGVCGFPDAGFYAYKKNTSWNFRRIGSSKDMFDKDFSYCSSFVSNDKKQRGYYVHMYDKANILLDNGKFLFPDEWVDMIKYNNGFIICVNKIDGKTMHKLVRFDGTVIIDYNEFLENYLAYENGYLRIQIKDSDGENFENCIDETGKLISEKWFTVMSSLLEHGFFYVGDASKKSEGKSSTNIMNDEGTLLFPDWSVIIRKYVFMKDKSYVIIQNDEFRYNVFSFDGKKVFDDWTDDVVMEECDGILRVGFDKFVDYDGEIATVI